MPQKEYAINSLIVEKLKKGEKVFFVSRGKSMFPFIIDGAILEIEPVNNPESIKKGDVVLTMINKKILCHRVINIKQGENGKIFRTKGDFNPDADPPFFADALFGQVVKIKYGENEISLEAPLIQILQKTISFISPLMGIFRKIYFFCTIAIFGL